MTDTQKKHLKAGLITLAVHASLVLLLAILTLSEAAPDTSLQDGVPVLLGMEEDAGGEDLGPLPASPEGGGEAIRTESSPEGEFEGGSPVSPPAQPAITQDTEKSIAAEAAKQRAAEEAARQKAAAETAKQRAAEEAARQKAAAETAKKRAAEEAARKKAAEEAAAKAAAGSRVAGAFAGANKGNSGNLAGNGSQGAPTGNSNVGTTAGAGGLGTGTSAQVAGRTVVWLARPQYADSNSEGTVLVSIQVNPAGAVTQATVTSSTTSSSALKAAAVAAARQSRFSEGAQTESGTITYRFKLR